MNKDPVQKKVGCFLFAQVYTPPPSSDPFSNFKLPVMACAVLLLLGFLVGRDAETKTVTTLPCDPELAQHGLQCHFAELSFGANVLSGYQFMKQKKGGLCPFCWSPCFVQLTGNGFTWIAVAGSSGFGAMGNRGKYGKSDFASLELKVL